MKIALAILVFIFLIMPRIHAAPLNNLEQKTAPVDTIGQPAKAEEPTKPIEPVETPAAQPVQVQEEPQSTVVEAAAKTRTPQITCGDNIYANFIYMHESGCRTTAVNSIGCRGIGQACPGSKLPCGDDYECQNQWFSNYAIQRYGSWERAYSTWLSQSWW